MTLNCVDHVKDHHQDIQSHTKCNSYHEYRIELSDKRQVRHRIHRP